MCESAQKQRARDRGRSAPPLALRWKTLLDFGQVRHRGFGMLGRHVGVPGFPVSDGFLQVLNALIQMRILHACGLRMLQRLFRMLRYGIGMTLLAMGHCALRMLNGFS